MKRIGKLLLYFMVMALAFSFFAPATFAANEINEIIIDIDGAEVNFEDQRPTIINGVIVTPVRSMFETLGFDVSWTPATQTVTLTNERYVSRWNPDARAMEAVLSSIEVSIVIGSSTFTINDEEFNTSAPAQIIGGRTMMPIHAILEELNYYASWDVVESTLTIKDLNGFHSFDASEGAIEAQLADPDEGDLISIIHTNFGEIHLRLFPDMAPLAVENFVTHAQDGYYDGVIFHRVIDGFMIQGGDPEGTGTGGESIWGMPFGDEFTTDLRHFRGALSMANSGANTNGSQFFIVQAEQINPLNLAALEHRLDNQDELSPWGGLYFRDIFPVSLIEFYLEHGGTPHLDFGHTVFGQVFIGMDVVDAIAATETGEADRPVEDVIIERIEILNFRR